MIMNISTLSSLRNPMRKLCIAFVIAVGAACSGDDDPDNKNQAGESSVTLNGGPYTNFTANTTEPGTAVYDPQEDVTVLGYSATVNGEPVVVIVSFPGKTPGEKTWNVDELCFAQVTHDYKDSDRVVTATFYHTNTGTAVEHSGHVKLDSFGEVGGIVSGSFQGDCTFVDSKSTTTTTGTMKGTFRVRRTQ
jgi:hypothetical protein